MSSVPPSPFPENQCLPKKLAAQVLCRHSVLRTHCQFSKKKGIFLTVLRIHEILVRIWIRARGSIPLTNGSGSCTNFFLLITFLRFTSFFKVKSHKRSHKTVGMFSYYFCLMIEGAGSGSKAVSVYLTNGSGSGRAKKHMDPTDPDPQHCFLNILCQCFGLFLLFFYAILRCNAGERDSDLHVDGRLAQGDHRARQRGQP
jgi:hypothetical protein